MATKPTRKDLQDAKTILDHSPLTVRTPVISNCLPMFKESFQDNAEIHNAASLSIKMEHMQHYGSFKIRGVVTQFHSLPADILSGEKSLVTMSAGNYGRSFSEACSKLGLKGKVILPAHAPKSRVDLIKSKGLMAEMAPGADLPAIVQKHVDEGYIFMHPFDDPKLFGGYGVCGVEIFEDLPCTDVIIACCGGGGFLAGVSSAAKLHNPHCRVYGVEPVTANSMYRSFEAGEAAQLPNAKSIASGLSPPYAGKNCYSICKETVESILLVTDDELRYAVRALYDRGLVVEAAGSAAFAAVMFNKVPDLEDKKVVVVLTGRNVGIDELRSIYLGTGHTE